MQARIFLQMAESAEADDDSVDASAFALHLRDVFEQVGPTSAFPTLLTTADVRPARAMQHTLSPQRL